MGKGNRLALSLERRLVDDVLRMAIRQPMAAFYRDLDLSPLVNLRKRIRPRLSWNAIMMKAYALVSRDTPELRQFYVRFPWPHLYQVEHTVAQIIVARDEGSKQRLYFARFHRPENHTLRQLQERLDHFQTAPLENIRQLRHQNRFASLPWFLRRAVWWLLMEGFPSQRATYLGTFGMSISGFNQTYGNCHLGPNTTIIGVDPTPRNGIARTLLTFDHRVLDGKPTIDVMSQLYSTLLGPIRQEMEIMLEREEAHQAA